MHNGQLGTEKIFKKVELGVSMARLTSNLVNASQIKWKKWKKGIEIGKIRTPVEAPFGQSEPILLIDDLQIPKLLIFREFPRTFTCTTWKCIKSCL